MIGTRIASRGRALAGWLALLLFPPSLCFATSSDVVLDHAMTAAIDARERDRCFPGATTMDAVHRAVLVRFPDALKEVSARVRDGMAVEHATLELSYAGYEVVPSGYASRPGLGEAKWRSDPPHWHVVAWALRRPWTADEAIGPTFNAHIAGAGFWSRYGASGRGDRIEALFGPEELSNSHPTASVDVTRLATGAEFGSDDIERARRIAEDGVLLRKLETYDTRYRDWADPYEWAVATGGHGLKFAHPRLVLTFRPAARRVLPAGSLALVDVGSLARRRAGNGRATAIVPSEAEFRAAAAAHWLPSRERAAWQRDRIAELARVGGGTAAEWMHAVETGDYAAYLKLIGDILATPPRYWKGWSIHDDILTWYAYRDLLPAFVQDHIREYWRSWLMPDFPTRDLVHPQSRENAELWEATHDWRGRSSFFRDGYNYAVSTQNFNNTASMGSLLGGAIIGSEYAIEDGRHGFEAFPLRFWTMLDGSTQEMLDHYYFSITLSGEKLIADFGPTAFDRLMARIALDRSIELLASAYHPALRRMVSVSSRTDLPAVLARQDGVYTVLHTLSRRGTLLDAGGPLRASVRGMRLWGEDLPPGRVALQAAISPWASDWLSGAIDEKPIPFEETSVERNRGAYTPPLWRRIYLGRHYGLASQDIKDGTVDFLAQWSRRSEGIGDVEDLGTLTVRYLVNASDLVATPGGVAPHPGGIITFQDRNRAIVFTKPRTERNRIMQAGGVGGLSMLGTAIGIWTLRDGELPEIELDGRAIGSLPAKVKAGQVVTIRDGVTYLGIIPMHATDLGRDEETIISGVSAPKDRITPSLLITSYNLRRTSPTPYEQVDWDRVNGATYGGFAIEIGDETEYVDFQAFSAHMRANQLVERWNASKRQLDVEYHTGTDVMEATFSADYPQDTPYSGVVPGRQTQAVPRRLVNGRWPYLESGLERDTTLSQQGTAGRLEKNGAVLISDPGRKAYLQTYPASGIFTGYNPLPDSTRWRMEVPGGIAIEADGAVGLLRVSVHPEGQRLWIDYALKPDQKGREMARHLLVSGFARAPTTVLNGRALPAAAIARTTTGFAVPLEKR